MKTITIQVNNLISVEDGKILYQKIKEYIINEFDITIDFMNTKLIISIAIIAMIGDFYNGEFDYDLIEKRLHFINLSNDDIELVNLAKENSKKYYANKEYYDNILKEEEL